MEPDKLFAERFQSCISCPYLKSASYEGGGECTACGCPIQTKLRQPGASCPTGKWPAIDLSKEAAKEEEGRKHPPVSVMAKNFFNSAVGFAASGFKITPMEEIQNRLDVCYKCENFDSSGFNGTGRCRDCGCSLKLKIRMASAECPVGKWGKA
jgi:hypothetical protein